MSNELDALEHDIRTALPMNRGADAIVHHVAKWLHSDGYRKLTIITTAAELAALKDGTIIRDQLEILALSEGEWWIRENVTASPLLPAVILFDGGEA